MIPFSLSELKAAAAGVLKLGAQFSKAHDESYEVTSVSTSSKEIADEHALFVPLKGERFDAHDFIGDALAHGAKVIGSARSVEQLKEKLADKADALDEVAVLECADTQRLLGLSGQIVRRKAKATVGAITGSCGKTTAKQMSAAILGQCGKTLYTNGNFNNDVGVPLTLLRLDESYDFAIIEQGASHLEDIARTAEFVEAQYALITNVGEAHILGFGSREGVYHGKSEILDKLFSLYPVKEQSFSRQGKLQGIGIVPCDSEWLAKWQEDYQEAFSNGKLLTFGEKEGATMQVSKIESVNGKLSFHLHSFDERYAFDADITLDALGRHNAINAAGAALLGLVMGASADDVIKGLSSTEHMDGRLTPEHFDSGLTVIDDAYNASFNAVIAAIDTLSTFKGKRVFIFGDMGELGDEEVNLHSKVGAHAHNKIDLLLCIGPLSQYSVQAMGSKALHFVSHDDLIGYLTTFLEDHVKEQDGVTCLVKGSHAMHMDKVVNALKELGPKL